jgi:fido (protein-threonine AMPylation protein)
MMCDNARYWVNHETFPPDEIAVRLHHRLTQIHSFPNGNGRHARMMADLLIEKLGGKRFTWAAAASAIQERCAPPTSRHCRPPTITKLSHL